MGVFSARLGIHGQRLCEYIICILMKDLAYLNSISYKLLNQIELMSYCSLCLNAHNKMRELNNGYQGANFMSMNNEQKTAGREQNRSVWESWPGWPWRTGMRSVLNILTHWDFRRSKKESVLEVVKVTLPDCCFSNFLILAVSEQGKYSTKYLLVLWLEHKFIVLSNLRFFFFSPPSETSKHQVVSSTALH